MSGAGVAATPAPGLPCIKAQMCCVGCIVHVCPSMQTVPHQLISGWSRLLEAIEVALLDPKLVMLVHAQATLPQAIAAAEGTDAFLLLLPQLLGLCALAATHEGHPHLCFAGLKSLQQIIEVLRKREIGKQVCPTITEVFEMLFLFK
jgi:hypothetical protein